APSDALLAALLLDEELLALARGGVVDRSYVDHYLEAADGALLKRGLALRLRVTDAGRWLELKGSGSRARGISRRPEWRQEAPDGPLSHIAHLPEGPVRQRLLACVPHAAPLSALFSCVVRRLTLRLQIPAGGWMELSCDQGEVRAGERRAVIREVELESLSGPNGAGFSFAWKLAGRHGLTVGVDSKFATGLALLRG
ncbi:MAG: CYTH domain-containing protein, partial [Magnetococcales bacterium]|nr:CYTH domain-containing protein [Magnetococcales bacterium]